jgi:hypothetical protein
MAEDDMPVSGAMIEAGSAAYSRHWKDNDPRKPSHPRDFMAAIYRAMERARRAEADAEVIRRSVKQD